jgi:hypothetical protein
VALIATLTPADISVEPGSQTSLTIKVRNTGSTVDRFDISVVGQLAAYAVANPPFLSLFPGVEGESTITFSPPREALPRAGTFPYGVRIRAAADPAGASVEEGRVTIGPFTDASAEIVPQTSRGSKVGRHDVIVENRGNAPVEVLVGAADPDRLVDFEVRPDRFVVGPGERNSASIRASARDTFFFGSKVQHPFNVEVRPGKSAPIPLRGTLLQGPRLPSWLIPVGGIAAVAIIALVALPMLTGSGKPATLAQASTGPGPTASPSPSPSPAPSSSESSGPASPSPSPTPGPFQLSITGDEISTSGALAVKCPPKPKDSQCLKDALDTVRALTTSLAGPFGGRGIVSTENTLVENSLPVVMTRDVPFPWVAGGGSVTDQTPTIVIDLAPLIATPPGFAYAVVDSAAGPRRFVLPDELARQLLETLYTPNPDMVPPIELRTPPPDTLVYDPGVLQFPIFVLNTPAP